MKKIPAGNDLPPNLSQPAIRALHLAGYTTLASLSKVSESDVARLHGVGPTAIVLIKAAFQEKGLSFMKAKK